MFEENFSLKAFKNISWWSHLKDRLKKLVKDLNGRILISGFLVIIGSGAIVFGLYQLVTTTNQNKILTQELDEIEAVQLKQSQSDQTKFDLIWLDISGGVKNPGIYSLESGSRLADLVESAGGFNNQASSYYINHQLNLARLLQDEEKIYIPTQADQDLEDLVRQLIASSKNEDSSNDVSSSTNLSSSNSSSNKVSINQATASELEELPGIGEKRAEDIIVGRPYESLEQLLDRDIVTETIYEKIKNEISL